MCLFCYRWFMHPLLAPGEQVPYCAVCGLVTRMGHHYSEVNSEISILQTMRYDNRKGVVDIALRIHYEPISSPNRLLQLIYTLEVSANSPYVREIKWGSQHAYLFIIILFLPCIYRTKPDRQGICRIKFYMKYHWRIASIQQIFNDCAFPEVDLILTAIVLGHYVPAKKIRNQQDLACSLFPEQI